ncbi:hypothetical protein GCM10010172_65900 [Paractinoplanes ferrugineus]|uniref:ATP-binding cassette subfamily B protein n=1 Tax=Paractinoplanes ferrugineus TaxID=113564 RepID=A0A919MFX6_9ACTN|nr:ABC transporter ATP-binding protein [Actinoplanes ferrugineus]GIE13249.1 hypothetical protein Afe05nite_50890 [Actinoplanes ferrugineus]
MPQAGKAVRSLIVERIRLLRLLGRSSSGATLGLCAVHLLAAVTPPLTAYAASLVVEAMNAPRPALVPCVVLGVLLLVGEISDQGREGLAHVVAMRVEASVRSAVRRLALAPDGIGHLENSDFADDAMRSADRDSALGRSRSLGSAATGQLTIMFRVLSALASTALLAAYFPVLAVALLVVALFIRSVIRRQWTALAKSLDARAQDQRMVYYLSELAVRGAAEIRVFGLGDWLAGRFRGAAFASAAPTWRRMWPVLRRQWWTVLVLAVCAVAALAVPASAALAGTLPADRLVACLLLAVSLFAITAMGQEAFDIEYGLHAMRALDRLTDRFGTAAAVGVVPRPTGSAPPLIRFENVGFTYPGADRPVFAGLTLTLRPGETVALVGENGAGKTTLVKLLCGLYRPTVGRITVDGQDLATMDPHAWRARIGVLFQDFIRYPSTLRDNIALSAPGQQDDDAVRAALRAAGGDDRDPAFPAGLDTRLWAEGADGVDLSGGQWQQVAIARLLYARQAGRHLLVLDEPTAHLDMSAEADFYRRVIRSVSGTTAILVSHRLSTVRHADRIVLLRDGQVAERGTHSELLTLDGGYARFFRLQAEPFQEEHR